MIFSLKNPTRTPIKMAAPISTRLLLTSTQGDTASELTIVFAMAIEIDVAIMAKASSSITTERSVEVKGPFALNS